MDENIREQVIAQWTNALNDNELIVAYGRWDPVKDVGTAIEKEIVRRIESGIMSREVFYKKPPLSWEEVTIKAAFRAIDAGELAPLFPIETTKTFVEATLGKAQETLVKWNDMSSKGGVEPAALLSTEMKLHGAQETIEVSKELLTNDHQENNLIFNWIRSGDNYNAVMGSVYNIAETTEAQTGYEKTLDDEAKESFQKKEPEDKASDLISILESKMWQACQPAFSPVAKLLVVLDSKLDEVKDATTSIRKRIVREVPETMIDGPQAERMREAREEQGREPIVARLKSTVSAIGASLVSAGYQLPVAAMSAAEGAAMNVSGAVSNWMKSDQGFTVMSTAVNFLPVSAMLQLTVNAHSQRSSAFDAIGNEPSLPDALRVVTDDHAGPMQPPTGNVPERPSREIMVNATHIPLHVRIGIPVAYDRATDTATLDANVPVRWLPLKTKADHGLRGPGNVQVTMTVARCTEQYKFSAEDIQKAIKTRSTIKLEKRTQALSGQPDTTPTEQSNTNRHRR